MMLFNRGGLEVVPVPSDFRVVGMSSWQDRFSLTRFLPQVKGSSRPTRRPRIPGDVFLLGPWAVRK